jgi:hypothetical protein
MCICAQKSSIRTPPEEEFETIYPNLAKTGGKKDGEKPNRSEMHRWLFH